LETVDIEAKVIKCPKCNFEFSIGERKQFAPYRVENPHPDYRGEDEYYSVYEEIECPKCEESIRND
jgi:hypothetical protein